MNNKGMNESIKYICLTYCISWLSWLIIIVYNQYGALKYGTLISMIPLTVGVCGPPIAIIFLLIKWHKLKKFRDFKDYLFVTANIKKTIIVTLVYCFIFFITIGYSFPMLDVKWYYFILDIPCMMFGGGFEELGWRGFLLPKLEKMIPKSAVLVLLGAIWACWHLPLWFINGTTQSSRSFLAFFVMCICWTAILASLRNLTNNLFSCVFLHSWINVLFDMYIINYDFSSITFWVLTLIEGFTAYIIYLKSNYHGSSIID